ASISSEDKQSVHMETALRVHGGMGVSLVWCEDVTSNPSYHLGEPSPFHDNSTGYRFMCMPPPGAPAEAGTRTNPLGLPGGRAAPATPSDSHPPRTARDAPHAPAPAPDRAESAGQRRAPLTRRPWPVAAPRAPAPPASLCPGASQDDHPCWAPTGSGPRHAP